MKLSYLKINSHLQFKDIEFKFTYPYGHDNAGFPLEKICFIGQSGTGKTVLLKLIKRIIEGLISNNPNKINGNESDYKMVFSLPERGENIQICSETELRENKKIIKNWGSGSGDPSVINSYLDRIKHVLITVEPDILSSSTFLFEHKNKYEEKKLKYQEKLANEQAIAYSKKDEIDKIISINELTRENLWHALCAEIQKYDEALIKFGVDVVQRKLLFKDESLNNAIKEWKHKNINPRKRIYESCLNPILDKFNIEGDEDAFESFFTLKNKNTTSEIPAEGLSTGTQNFIITSLPLFLLDTKKSIIIIDEPERSLFPDIQLEIIDHYTKICPDSQLIVATHSPIIAASFEPCERFILYYDDEGNVRVKNGEAPRGDDPNALLRKDFNIEYLNEYGIKMWERFIELKSMIESENDKAAKLKMLEEFREIGDKYNFEV